MTTWKHTNEQTHSDIATYQSHTQMERQEPAAQSHLAQSHLDEHPPTHTHIYTQKTCKLEYTLLQKLCAHTSLPNTWQGTLNWALSPGKFRSTSLPLSIPLHAGSPIQLFIPGLCLLPGLWFAHPAPETTDREVLLFISSFNSYPVGLLLLHSNHNSPPPGSLP